MLSGFVRVTLLLLVSVLLMIAAPPIGWAQSTDPQVATPEELDQLIHTLEDAEDRDRLLRQLKTLRSAQKAASGDEQPFLGQVLIATLSAKVQGGRNLVESLLDDLLRLPGWILDFTRRLGDPTVRTVLTEAVLKIAFAIGAARFAEWVIEFVIRRPRKLLELKTHLGTPLRLFFSFVHLLLDLIPLAAFGLIAQLILPLTNPRVETNLAALALINALLLARGLNRLGDAVFVPGVPNLRLWSFSDKRAAHFARWWRFFANVIIYTYFASGLAGLVAAPTGLVVLAKQIAGFVVALMACWLIWQNRGRAVADQNGSAQAGPASVLRVLKSGIIETWHVFAILYVFALYVIWALGLPGGFYFLVRATIFTGIIFFSVHFAVGSITQILVKAVTARLKSSSGQSQVIKFEARLNHYLPTIGRIINLLIYLLAALLLAESWGGRAFTFFSTDTGKQLASAGGSILLVSIVGTVIWECINAAIDHYLLSHVGSGKERRQRLQTILPLLRNVIRLSILTMVILIILSRIGINIAPLLAGAGVIGVAVGFGAQTLVKDIITGLFILAEDTIAVGDVVEINSYEGKVDGITIRTVRLRDDEGAVHTIPYSLIESIKNKSKDYSNVIIELSFAAPVEYESVSTLLAAVGAELRAEPVGRYLLADIEIQGVSKLRGDVMTLRTRLRVSPGRQRPVTRAFYLALKKHLEAANINLAD